MRESELKRAVFVDRDGVLVEEVGHLRRPEQLALIDGAAEAVRQLRAAGFLVVVVTNQAAVARGLLSEAELAGVHERMRVLLAEAGASIDDLFYCPHHPDHGAAPYRASCDCRKPAPGLLLAAAAKHDIELTSSWLVGDKRSDVEAAHRAGARAILVLTGHGETSHAAPAASDAEAPDAVCADLRAAAAYITER